MDAGNRVKLDRFQRIQGAKLLVDSKCYPLYKGVNLIGRNKTATVNIKNLNVSQNQAVIILIDENQHFLSDFNSSNGTQLHNTELTPFKLYDLTDNADIKFGNVSAKYFRMNFEADKTVDLQETMEMTQNMTQTFYGANTQLLMTLNSSNNEHSYFNETTPENIHEIVTQKMDYPDKIPLQLDSNAMSKFLSPKLPLSRRDSDFHNATTQLTTQNVKQTLTRRDSDFHNATTQLLPDNKNEANNFKNSSEVESTQIVEENCIIENVDTNMHEAPTQIVTFPTKLQENSQVSTSTSQETIINEDIPIDINFASRKTTLHDSQEASTSGLNRTFDDSFPVNLGNTCSEHIIEDSVIDDTVRESLENANSNDSVDFLEMEMRNKEKVSSELNSFKNDSCPDDKSEKECIGKGDKSIEKHDTSDSDTDIEEPIKKSINKQLDDDDSDTDIDEAVVSNKNKTRKEIVSNSSQDSEVIVPVRKRHVQLQDSDIDEFLDLKSGDSDTDLDELAAKTIAKLKAQDKITNSSQDSDIGSKRKKVVKLPSDSSENNTDPPTQNNSDTELDELMVTSITKFKEQENSNSSQGSDVVRSKRKMIPKLPDTQLDPDDVEHTDNSNVNKEKKNDKKENSFNDSDIIPATQVCTFEHSEHGSEESFKLGITELMDDRNSQTQKDEKMYRLDSEKNGKIKEDDIVEDADMIPTQKIVTSTKNDVFVVPESQSSKKFTFKRKQTVLDESLTTILATNTKNDEDVYMAATQRITEVDSIFKQPVGKSDTVRESQDDIYLQATQSLNVNTQPISNLNTSLDENDDVFLIPTQKIETGTQKINEADDGLFKQPFSRSHKNKDHEDDIYILPTQPLKVNKDKVLASNLHGVDEDDMFMMPTQRIEIDSNTSKQSKIEDTVEDPYLQSTQKIVLIDDPPADLDPYDLPTQCIISENNENDTQKELQNYNEQTTKVSENRPDNPVAHILTEKNIDTDNLEYMEDIVKDNFQVPDGPVTRRSKKTLENKVLEERPETLSQIETFIKQTTTEEMISSKRESKTKSESEKDIKPSSDNFQIPNSPVSRRSRKLVENKVLEDRPETLSQIETFIKQTENTGDSGNKHNQLKKRIETKEDEEDRPETLSQIVAFIKQPVEVSKQKLKSTSKDGKIEEIQTSKEKKIEVRTAENTSSDVKGKRLSKRRLSKQEDESLLPSATTLNNIPEDDESNDFEPSPKVRKVQNKKSEHEDSSGQDSRSDPDQSFITLLESKNTKVKKTRNSNLGQIQVKATANRRSMGITETSMAELTETRKSTRRTVNAVKTSKETKTADKIVQKDKSSSCSGSELSDSEASAKIAGKGNTKNKKGSKTIDEVKEIEPTESKPTRRAGRKNSASSTLIESTSAKRVSRRNSASSASSDTPKINKKNKRNTRGIIEENEETKEEKSINKETTSEEIITVGKSTRGKKRTKEIEQRDAPQIKKSSIFSSSEDVTSKSDQSTSSEPATPLRGKRISKVKNVEPNEPSTPKRGQKSVSTEVLLNSAERTKRKLKPKVVFTMYDNPQLETMIKRMGGSVVDSIDSSTVLVTEHVKRTQKLLTAVGQGKPICSPSWLQACKKENEFLDPWDHILLDKEAEKKWDFSLKESLIRASQQKLLHNYVFQIMVTNATEVLKGSIEACGGKCVSKSPGKNSEGNFVIVASPEHKSKYSKIVKQNPDVKVIEPEAIFDGVLRQELRFSRHLLT